jgi:hypothetical protein
VNTCAEVRKSLQAVEIDQAWGFCGGTAPAPATCTEPFIQSVYTNYLDRTYRIDDTIKIGVSFSRPVSSDSVTLKMKVGHDRTCSFAINNAMYGFCDYTVQKGDYSVDLDVEVSGVIKDDNDLTITDLTPKVSLSSNHDIVIDGRIIEINPDLLEQNPEIPLDDQDIEVNPDLLNPNLDIPLDKETPENNTDQNPILNPPTTNNNYEIPSDSGDRQPNFEVTVTDDGLATYTVTGKINYYGTYQGCENPRYFDPVIVRWGQANTILTPPDMNFTATHTYNVKNPEYDLSISVVNSCFQSTTRHFTVKPHL